MAKVRWQKAEGALARVKGREFTPEDGEEGSTPLVHLYWHCAVHRYLYKRIMLYTLL